MLMDFNFSFKCACSHASHPWISDNCSEKVICVHGADQHLTSQMTRNQNFLVFSHIVCKRLSVMQELGPVWRFCCQNQTDPILRKEYPQEMELLMDGLWVKAYQEDLGTSVLTLPRIPPELELCMKNLGTLVLSLPRIPPPPHTQELEFLMEDFAGNWCVETNRYIPCGYLLVKIYRSMCSFNTD